MRGSPTDHTSQGVYRGYQRKPKGAPELQRGFQELVGRAYKGKGNLKTLFRSQKGSKLHIKKMQLNQNQKMVSMQGMTHNRKMKGNIGERGSRGGGLLDHEASSLKSRGANRSRKRWEPMRWSMRKEEQDLRVRWILLSGFSRRKDPSKSWRYHHRREI